MQSILLYIFLIVIPAQNITLADHQESYDLSESIYILEDKADTITIDHLKNNKHGNSFKPAKTQNINIGFSRSAFWLKIPVSNHSEDQISLILGLNYPLLNEIHFYEVRNQKIKNEFVTGELHSSHDLKQLYYNIPLELNPGEQATYFIHVRNHGETVRMPLSLKTKDHYYTNNYKDIAIKLFYYGFIFFAFFFNLLLFISIKDKVYIFFAFYVAFLMLFLLNTDGYGQLLWGNHNWWANHSTIFYAMTGSIFLLFFTKSYLKLRQLTPYLNTTFNIIIILAFLIFLGGFTNYPFYINIVKIVNFSCLLNVLLVTVVTLLVMKKNPYTARLFLISFILLLVGVSLYVLRNAGVLPICAITKYGVKIGFGFQILLLSFAVSERFRNIMLTHQEKLEKMVRERTNKILKQAEEIELQRDHVTRQRDQIAGQKKEITDSIHYAEKIQSALLPAKNEVEKIFDKHFILYKPKDIVSGDFYFIRQIGAYKVVIAADCTGHGVPGAFMSMLGITFLNEILCSKNISRPHIVLQTLKEYIIRALHQSDKSADIKDGINMSICVVHTAKRILYFSGAVNGLYRFTNNKLEEYKGIKMPIGYSYMDDLKFKTTTIPYDQNDMIYLFSDGYIDQFGGPTTKKFGTKAFKNLLYSVNEQILAKQKQILSQSFDDWKNNHEQLDDVLIIGIRL